MARWTSQNCTVKFIDATAVTPEELVVGPGPGDLTISEWNDQNAERIRVLNRGAFDGHIIGDDLEQTWSITIELQNQSLTEVAADRINDWIQKTGNFSGNTSVSSDPNIWAWIVEWSASDGTNTAKVTLPLCVGSAALSEAKEGTTLTLSGTNNGIPTFE